MLLNKYKLGRLYNIVALLSNIYSAKIFYWRICPRQCGFSTVTDDKLHVKFLLINTDGLFLWSRYCMSLIFFSSVMVEIFHLSWIYKHINHSSQKQHLMLYITQNQALILLVGLCYQIVPGKTDRTQ